MKELPQIKLGQYDVSRLIIGGNPIKGFSHISEEMNKEMRDYYNNDNDDQDHFNHLMEECLANGINTIMARGDEHITRLLKEYRRGGGKIQLIAQTVSEIKIPFKQHLDEILTLNPIAIYLHGTLVDNCFHKNKIKTVYDSIKQIKDTGVFTGLATHRPNVMRHVEEHNLGVDFYMPSFYNLAKKIKHFQATDGFKEEEFDDSDKYKMIDVIQQTEKPCLVFKILGAGRKATNDYVLKSTFEFAFENIKPIDAVVVGMWLGRKKQQVKENADIVREILK